MKKLMIAAAVAAMATGSFADLCSETKTIKGKETKLEAIEEHCAGFDFKMTLTTLVPKKVKANDCNTSCYYFEKGKRTFNGILWDCVASCEDLKVASNFVAWEKARKVAVTAPLAYYAAYLAADKKSVVPGATVSADVFDFDFLNRFSKKANQVQGYVDALAFNFGDLALAGFGKWDAKKEIVSSISGYAVGAINSGSTCGDCADPNAEYYVLPLCEEFDGSWCDEDPVGDVAAYGSWSIKYNKKISSGKSPIWKFVPSYATDKVPPAAK